MWAGDDGNRAWVWWRGRSGTARSCRSSCLHSLARVRLGEGVACVACHIYTAQAASTKNQEDGHAALRCGMRGAAVARMQVVCRSVVLDGRGPGFAVFSRGGCVLERQIATPAASSSPAASSQQQVRGGIRAGAVESMLECYCYPAAQLRRQRMLRPKMARYNVLWCLWV